MTPADVKDWWLAAAAITTVVTPSLRADAATTEAPVGVVAATVGEVRNITGDEVLFVGGNMFQGQTLETDVGGALHILFMDQSSMTLGAGSRMTIDHFAFDNEANVGKIVVTLNKGSLRVVGGKISKTTATEVRTDSALVQLRGGIAVVENNNQQTSATFLFGQSMRVGDPAATNFQTVTRPGFGVTTSGGGVSEPQRISVNSINASMGNFETRPQTTGGASGAGGVSGAGGGVRISTGGLNPPGAPSQTLSPDRLSSTGSSLQQLNQPSTNRPSQDRDQSQNVLRRVLGADASTPAS